MVQMRICAASARASAAPAASPQASARRAASSSNGAATRAFWWLNANETARWSSGSADELHGAAQQRVRSAAVATPAHPDSRALQASGCLLGDRSVGPTELGQIQSGLLEVVAEDLVQLDEALPVLPQPLREAPVEVGPRRARRLLPHVHILFPWPSRRNQPRRAEVIPEHWPSRGLRSRDAMKQPEASVILAIRSACLLALLAVVANLAACGSGHHAPTTSAETTTVTYRWAKPSPIFVQIEGPAGAAAKQAHYLRANFERTHPTVVPNAPGHAICTFPGLLGSVTVRLYGDKKLVSARCKLITKELGE